MTGYIWSGVKFYLVYSTCLNYMLSLMNIIFPESTQSFANYKNILAWNLFRSWLLTTFVRNPAEGEWTTPPQNLQARKSWQNWMHGQIILLRFACVSLIINRYCYLIDVGKSNLLSLKRNVTSLTLYSIWDNKVLWL